KLFLNMNGYEISKDALSLAMNLNDSFRSVALKLLNEGVKENNINNVIEYIEYFLEANIEIAAKTILDVLEESSLPLSSKEILEHESFKDFNIKMEAILKYLYNKGIVLKESRSIDVSGMFLIDENVYSVR
ncbi:MAG: nucleotidyltransferase domain-containing protein, partial [Clostridium sp.]